MQRIFLSLFIFLNFASFHLFAKEEVKKHSINSLILVEVNSSINPATFNYLSSAHRKAKQEKFDAVLIKINTPGGLVSTTKDILTLIGSADIPTIVWVTPEGASATSAGAIIASGAHALFMSEGTNMGAATPIQMSGDIPGQKKKEDKSAKDETVASDARKKAINDLVALVQSLSEARGRNGKLFGEMIEKASSFKAREAVEKNLIDGIANTEKELFSTLNGRILSVKGQKLELQVETPRVDSFEMDLGQKLLNVLADPSLAYILFLLAAALIYLEFQAPGGFVAGSLGVLFLILAGIGFQVLPLNFGALGLLALSFMLFILEAYITSYGILSLAGIASLLSGSLFLYRTDDSYLELSRSLIYSSVGSIVAFLLFIVFVIIKDQKNVGSKEFNSMKGKMGIIVEELPSQEKGIFIYQVKVGGEFWKAQSKSKKEIGSSHEVTDQSSQGMILII